MNYGFEYKGFALANSKGLFVDASSIITIQSSSSITRLAMNNSDDGYATYLFRLPFSPDDRLAIRFDNFHVDAFGMGVYLMIGSENMYLIAKRKDALAFSFSLAKIKTGNRPSKKTAYGMQIFNETGGVVLMLPDEGVYATIDKYRFPMPLTDKHTFITNVDNAKKFISLDGIFGKAYWYDNFDEGMDYDGVSGVALFANKNSVSLLKLGDSFSEYNLIIHNARDVEQAWNDMVRSTENKNFYSIRYMERSYCLIFSN